MADAAGTTRERGQGDVVLEVNNAQVSYEMSRGRARVLDDINLEIRRGETLGVVGESGCGKSMLASSLMDAVKDPGLLTGDIVYHPEDADSIRLLDLSSSDLKRVRWEEIAMVYQGAKSAFNPTQTIRVHFKETLDAHNVDTGEGMERAEELLREVDLDPDRILDAHQNELSGGEKQRTMLALSLLLEPEILILDEPTAGLDLLTQRNVLELLVDLKERYDLTLIFITHDLPLVAGLADRLAVMYAFEIVEQGSIRDVMYDPDHPYTRMMLRATMSLSRTIDEISVIEGDTPDPVNVPVGCSFHPRCPIARDRCEAEEPELRAAAGGDHRVACFYPDVAADEIPIPVDRDWEVE